jgi:hypothetical protein
MMKRGIRAGASAFGAVLWLTFQSGVVAGDAIQAAIDRGVNYLKQNQVVANADETVGANALAGLTLLECGVPASDPAVQRVTGLVRSASPGLTHTYSLALSIMFLDRLEDPGDVPLIQSMTVRLLAGQNGAGGWTYHCPSVSQEEINRLTNLVMQRNELRGGREVPPAPAPARERRPVRELPREIQNQLQQLHRRGPGGGGGGPMAGGDNSNTQFAILGLWVGHRHGVPVEKALLLTEQRFRQSQNADGGWGYLPPRSPSTATMTCAGLLGLALAYGSVNEAVLRTEPGIKDPKKGKTGKTPRDPGKDPQVRAGLQALATAIGVPSAQTKLPVPVIPRTKGNHIYYFMWSLERVAVAYDLQTIGRKDWYGWGSEILVASQGADGSWAADYAGPVDTCFALLFLRRANLAQDLTASLKGKVTDPGEVALKAGGVGGENLKGQGLKPALDFSNPPKDNQDHSTEKKVLAPASKDTKDQVSGKPVPPPATVAPAAPATPPQEPEGAGQADRLSVALIKAPAGQQEKLLDEFKNGKGGAYTQALATAIPQLPAATQGKARDALAERLMRMTAATLRDKLKDDDAEIRVAAARACAGKEDLSHVPDLIPLLEDPQLRVVRAARTALKYLAKGKDFGPAADATPAERAKAMAEWKKWWKNQKSR